MRKTLKQKNKNEKRYNAEGFTGQPVRLSRKNKINAKRRPGVSPSLRRYFDGKEYKVLKGQYGRAEQAGRPDSQLVFNHRTKKGTPADRR